MSHKLLFSTISDYLTLNEAEKHILQNCFESIQVKKHVLLEEENKETQYLYFINDGFVRVFFMNDGEDRTTQINCPSRFITSFQSFITQSKAYDNVETITDCDLLRISKANLDKLNTEINNWGVFGEKIYEQALVYNEDRTRDMILLTAEERYLKLIKNHPDIVQNVPLQYIASYIGIKPESLSRIRRQIIS